MRSKVSLSTVSDAYAAPTLEENWMICRGVTSPYERRSRMRKVSPLGNVFSKTPLVRKCVFGVMDPASRSADMLNTLKTDPGSYA